MTPEEAVNRQQLVNQFQIVQDTLIHLSKVTQKKNLVFTRNKYAEGLVRKASLQLLTIRNIYEAGEWKSVLNNTAHNLYYVDSLSVSTVLRGAFECMLTLNHVFVNAPGKDEIELRYLLWALSTYISKDQAALTRHNQGSQARQQIRAKIDEVVNYMITLPIVLSLDAQSQKIIRDKAAPKTGGVWEYYIDGARLKKVENGWHGLAERMPAHKGVFNNLYKLLSLNSHPTWHSIDLIVNGFEPKESKNFQTMDLMLGMGAMVGSFILYDYCNLFTEVKDAFHQLPPAFIATVNFLLISFKGQIVE